jgi:hypothetical protein
MISKINVEIKGSNLGLYFKVNFTVKMYGYGLKMNLWLWFNAKLQINI